MSSPFPGMDPYLEDPNFWHSFHVKLAVEIANQLSPIIGPKYYADVEVRTVAEEITLVSSTIEPDTGIYEIPTSRQIALPTTTLAIPKAPTRRVQFVADALKLRTVRIYRGRMGELVTAIEILSPTNKRPHDGLDEYRRKREELFHSSVHLVEIDLLRGGTRPGPEVNEPLLEADYVMVVNRSLGKAGRVSDIWSAILNEPLPTLPIPLLDPDPDVPLDLNTAIHAVYERGHYDWYIDYHQPVPQPALRPEMETWVKELLAHKVKEREP